MVVAKNKETRKNKTENGFYFKNPLTKRLKADGMREGEREKSREALSNRLVMKGDARGHHFFQLQKSH